MANIYTVNYQLPKPSKGDLDWDAPYHEAMDSIDELIKSVSDNLNTHKNNTNNPHSTSFIKLTDTFASYTGLANRVVVVNGTATGLTTVTKVPSASNADTVGGKYATDFVEKNFKTATITTTWSGTEAPYIQEITISGIRDDHKPIIGPIYDDDVETAIAQQEAWSLIDKIVTDTNKIICYCFTDKPEVAIDIQLWVV